MGYVMEAKLLTSSANYAVVHLPERTYPGVVFQGDTLINLSRDLRSILTSLKLKNVDVAAEELDYVLQDIDSVVTWYRGVCSKNDINIDF
jgi:hypothetical protein